MLSTNTLHFYSRSTPSGLVEDQTQPYDFGTVYLINEAEQMGISTTSIPNSNTIAFQFNGNIRYIRNRLVDSVSHISFISAQNKDETKVWLEKENISVCKGYIFKLSDGDNALHTIFESLKKPLFVKPSDASHGDGISTNITSLIELESAVQIAFTFNRSSQAGVLIEETFIGDECRIFVSKKNGVIAAMKRVPANVIGDGKSTIGQLIENKNMDPRRLSLDGALFRKIEIDENLLKKLQNQSLGIDSIPGLNQSVFLRDVSNLSMGGDGVDITDELHSSCKKIAHSVVLAMPGFEFVGLDFMSTDFTKQQTADSYKIIEVNAAPELAIHDDPIIGKKRFACRAVLLHLFPELEEKFPIISQ